MKLKQILGSASLAVLATAGGAHAADKYVVGVSNTLIGNGWREEMICSIKAEAEASGKVSPTSAILSRLARTSSSSTLPIAKR
jgi:ribose transport system substrate-binding protein